jgi:histidinol-phosphate aminotransferase
LNPDFSLPSIPELRRSKLWDFNAALTFITTPNAPGGCGYASSELEVLCEWMTKGVVVLDEAYADFARENAMPLALKYPHVIVSRTFSKAYSLCFQRVGYFVGHADLIHALHKIRDSYNVNGLGQVAAEATLADLPYYRKALRTITTTREEAGARLTQLGFKVLPSETNFILARPPKFPAGEWLVKLRTRKILVRWFNVPELKGFLRITIGTPAEMEQLVRAAAQILKSKA